MSATDMPAVSVRFARTAGPFAEPAAADWVTLSGNPARSLSTRAGRPSPLERVPPTELTLVLDNTNGDLDPRNTLGAYYPDVVPDRHIEVSITPDDGLGARVLFRGYVERWQPQWSKGQAVVVITAKDAKGLFARHRLWPSVAEHELLDGLNGAAARNYWPMADVATVVPGATSTSTPNLLVASRPLGLEEGVRTVSEPFLPFDNRGAVNFAGPDSGQYGQVTGLVSDNNNEWTIEFLLHALDKSPDLVRLVDGQGFYVTLWNNNVEVAFVRASDGVKSWTPSVSLKANRTHLITLNFNAAKEGRLYVNGTYIGGVAVGGNIQGHYLGTGYTVAAKAVSPVFAKAWIGRLTSWDYPRYQANHTATWDALRAPWNADANMANRFLHLLNELGWPVALRQAVGSISRAAEPMAPQGQMALEYLDHLEDSEGGYIYVTPAGVVTFVLNTAPTDFADVLGTGGLPHADGVQVVDGVADIVTEVEAIRRADGTPIVVKDATAAGKHGTITRRLSGLLNIDRAGATGEMQTLLNRYKVERPRVEKLVLYPRRADTGWSVPLAAHTGKGYRFKYAPETGSAHDWNTSALTVDHDADWQAATWTTTLSLLWEANAV